MLEADASKEERWELIELREEWHRCWEPALDAWSTFTKLAPPRWCMSIADEERQGLAGSFAMIRLQDHAVVISLWRVQQMGLGGFATEILAHEIGHHVYAPGDLRDNARLLASTRAGLPGLGAMAPMVANLYTDLLINDRLQRSAQLDMAGVYAQIRSKATSQLWAFYMHTYENLWGLPAGSLFAGKITDRVRGDAILASRLVRNYSGDWLAGAGRFAVLCLDYLEQERERAGYEMESWLDTISAGAGDVVPEGMTGLSDEEMEGPRHPALDEVPLEAKEELAAGRSLRGGQKNRYRSPSEYTDLIQSLGVKVDPKELIIRYYRELARPHITPFPIRGVAQASDPQIEGVERWEPGSPLSSIDWMETALRSPVIIPGVTTVERIIGQSQGDSREMTPADLYIGVDCSGSMSNPAFDISYPVIAGTVVAMSAIRAGAKVKTVLSGSPGRHTQTPDYSSRLGENLGVLTDYLGTGYAFGLDRLDEEFVEGPDRDRPVHILLITDTDIFEMLDRYKNGWEVARQAMEKAGGGVSCVIEYRFDKSRWAGRHQRLEEIGWELYTVADQEELVAFARDFSRKKYTIDERGRR